MLQCIIHVMFKYQFSDQGCISYESLGLAKSRRLTLVVTCFLLQATNSYYRGPISLASKECDSVNFEHHNTEGWDGSKAFSSPASNDFHQVSTGQHEVLITYILNY